MRVPKRANNPGGPEEIPVDLMEGETVIGQWELSGPGIKKGTVLERLTPEGMKKWVPQLKKGFKNFYAGVWKDGSIEGIAIFQHPANEWYPAPWLTRDYGFFSPTPMNWLKEGHLDFANGETLLLRYRVVVHEGGAEEAGIAQRWADYEKTTGERKP